ncbi:alkyl/aryl-sulfatase [Streptomyces sp. NPDC057499]|uniref:alkyl/aryl-sulfatase n=1 Tax=Streptomyces sp. NPDC057499 TaxID=3346150 RepID=UPI0036BEB170
MTHAPESARPQKPAHPFVALRHKELRDRLPLGDTQDFEDAARGLIASRVPGAVTAADGSPVWDGDTYAFLGGEAPDTVNPSLWRQSRLVAGQGLFEVVEGIYQVRGLDLSNVTFVEGDTGVIVIDPLISTETAAAALALYREHRGERPVAGVVYTHSHVDHFGGVKGVTTQEDVDAGRVPVIAPEGFTGHAVAENVYAGTAMGRRAAYMYGAALPRGVRGQVGAGLGQTTSTGTVTLIVPTLDVTVTGQEETVDGVRMVFQMAPDTEAPAELLIHFPGFRALCAAEDATHTLHNLLTLRGALVRDPNAWSKALTETIGLFGDRTDVVFASHHWPTWGQERVVRFLETQRDLYGYLHDQSLRLINKGWTGAEIAERLQLPPALENAWHARGYYGSVSHNLKAVYQRYMGWFDGNPAHLWQHPPVEAGLRYVEFMGGADAVVGKARGSFDAGDFRWAAEVLSHVVFADPGHTAARELLADTFEQLGYGAENGTWRNFYLSGATELRDGRFGTPTLAAAPDIVANLTPPMLFDALAIQIDGPRAWHERIDIDVMLTDTGARYRLRLSNGVLSHTAAPQKDAADVTLSATVRSLASLAGQGLTAQGLERAGVRAEGDVSALGRLAALLDPGDRDFPIVTP